ncbi:hypothetical protein K7B10_34070 [Streptomyces flavotricini]|uniref:RsbT co-antagonist protein RsbRD N-terminal domain-containing protein n=1 Tax=Streptomyces flavotricini TaxID=66888 RepID=A0ABS8EF76_9ACTN|nr:hypothetical protein [Streptomyces flavotricini]MCC0099721.1 hypothetical protein [Streptomyces flavotricini]
MERIIEEIREDLSRRITVTADRLADRTLAEDPAYAALLGRAELRERIRLGLRQCVEGLDRGVRGLPVELDDARATGTLLAEQGLPLASLLRTYRRGGRMVWQTLNEAVAAHDPAALPRLLPAAAVLWDVLDRLTDAVGDAYRRAETARSDRDREQRAALLDALLDGAGPPEGPAARLGLPERGRFAVVVLAPGAAGAPAGSRPRQRPARPGRPARACCGASAPTGRPVWWSWATIPWDPYGSCSARSAPGPGSARSWRAPRTWPGRTGWPRSRCAPPPRPAVRAPPCSTSGCPPRWSPPRPNSRAGCGRWCSARCWRCPRRTAGCC